MKFKRYKKLLFVALLSTVFGVQAVLLKDGSSVPRAKVNHVYYALMSLLHNKNVYKRILLADLVRSCDDQNIPKKLTRFALTFNQEISEKECFETAIALGLCDKDGIIDEETAHIILSSVDCWFKGRVPFCVDVHSPVSWWAWTEIFKKSPVKK